MRSVAPTAAQRRALDELLSPKKPAERVVRKSTRSAGVVGYSEGVIAIPVPRGWDQLTQEQRIDLWEKHAQAQQEALTAATSPDREHAKEAA